MKRAVYVPIFNDYANPSKLVALAVAAEDAGFDGLFIWDHLVFEPHGALEVTDAIVALGAIAQATQRLRIGALITPLARRRPWKFSREMTALDHLSGGRVVIGAGLGEPAELEFGAFGEDPSPRVRAAKLDEALHIVDRLTRGESVTFEGRYHQVKDARFAPAAIQQPRMPIWVAASLPARAGLRRAARWDGVVPVQVPQSVIDNPKAPIVWPEWWLSPDLFGDTVTYVNARRQNETPFDHVASGRLGDAGCGDAGLAEYAARGATWWLDWVDEDAGTFERTLEMVKRGPQT